MRNFMVFDIGGSSIKWSVINEVGDIFKSGKIKLPKSFDEFISAIKNTTNENTLEYNLKGIAVSAPGAVNSDTGIIGGASAVPYIHGPNIKEILKSETGLNVEIENDANCAALGECWIGAAKEEQDSAFVVCGTGIGGSIVKDKKVHKGTHMHGGEFGFCLVGYYPGEDRPFPTWSEVGSTAVLAKKVAIRKGLNVEDVDGLKVFELCEQGDKIALEELDKYYYYMAMGIYNIQYTYDPEVIVLGGAISEREDYVSEIYKRIDHIININDASKVRPVIRSCKYGNDANKLGALYNYLQREK